MEIPQPFPPSYHDASSYEQGDDGYYYRRGDNRSYWFDEYGNTYRGGYENDEVVYEQLDPDGLTWHRWTHNESASPVADLLGNLEDDESLGAITTTAVGPACSRDTTDTGARELSIKYPNVRMLEVGAGGGELCAKILEIQKRLGPVTDLQEMIAASDYTGPDHPMTLVAAREAGVVTIPNVDANSIDHLFASNSLYMVLSSQAYGYGLTDHKTGRPPQSEPWFLLAALRIVRIGGRVIIISRSNLLFYRFEQCESSNLKCEYTKQFIQKHNRTAVSANSAKLDTINGDTDISPQDLEALAMQLSCAVTVSPVTPPPQLETFAHADEKLGARVKLLGFNVQITFIKLQQGSQGSVTYTRDAAPLWGQNFRTYLGVTGPTQANEKARRENLPSKDEPELKRRNTGTGGANKSIEGKDESLQPGRSIGPSGRSSDQSCVSRGCSAKTQLVLRCSKCGTDLYACYKHVSIAIKPHC